MSPFHKVSLKPMPWWESPVRKVLVNQVGKYQKSDSKESVALSKTSKIAYHCTRMFLKHFHLYDILEDGVQDQVYGRSLMPQRVCPPKEWMIKLERDRGGG